MIFLQEIIFLYINVPDTIIIMSGTFILFICHTLSVI